MSGTHMPDGVYLREGKQKTFIPLENNPEVFSHLVHKLGVSKDLGFYDVYSIDDPDLLAFIPRPVYALLFICPANVYHKARDPENDAMSDYTGSGANEPVIWYKQTIGHACGLMGLLHAVSNGAAKSYISPGSDLDKLVKAAVPLTMEPRAELLYNSKELEAAHMAAARIGDTAPPSAEDDNWNHYICFVKGDDGHLWELNGGMKGPVNRGKLNEEDDALSETALELGIRTFLSHAQTEDVGFSIVALAPALD